MFRFRGRYDNGRYDFGDNRVAEYAYHLAGFRAGSGDYAFMALVDNNGNPVLPFIDSVEQLKIPFSVISGTHDFVTGHHIHDIEARAKVRCATFQIDGGGHHTYATHSVAFHDAVVRSLELIHKSA
jgi:pimeloyl-ACP methyl ester carboxylesterase